MNEQTKLTLVSILYDGRIMRSFVHLPLVDGCPVLTSAQMGEMIKRFGLKLHPNKTFSVGY